MTVIHRLSLLCLSCLILALPLAAADNSSPEAVVREAVAALENNDIAGLVEAIIAPSVAEEMQAGFAEMQAAPASDEEKAQFVATMAMVTAPGAEDLLFSMAQPQLAEAQAQIQQIAMMMPMMISMGLADQGLSPEEQQQMTALMTAIQGWVSGLDITDEVKLKETLGVICTTARGLGIASIDDFKSLTFDEFLAKLGPVSAGLKQILFIYGFDADGVLASTSIGAPTIEGDYATVSVTQTLFGQEITTTSRLIMIDGKWYANATEDEMDMEDETLVDPEPLQAAP